LFTLYLSEFMYSVHSVFYVSMLEPAIFNLLPKRTELAPTPVIINKEPKYEISQIVDSKIDYQQVCKLLYKVIWLEYEDTEDKSEWISVSKLTHVSDLVSNFHITYPTKLSLLPLFWSHCCTCPLPPCTCNGNSSIIFLVYSIYLLSFNPSFSILYRVFLLNLQISIFISIS